MLRTALEALTGTSDAAKAIGWLEYEFDKLKGHGAIGERFTEHLLWSPSDVQDRALVIANESGTAKTYLVSDLGHWFSALGQARHQIVHEGLVPQLSYEAPDSRYNGPLFNVGERFAREGVKASLVEFGYLDLWETEVFRGIKQALASSHPALDTPTTTR